MSRWEVNSQEQIQQYKFSKFEPGQGCGLYRHSPPISLDFSKHTTCKPFSRHIFVAVRPLTPAPTTQILAGICIVSVECFTDFHRISNSIYEMRGSEKS